jgi:ribosomal protein L37AE/L43A
MFGIKQTDSKSSTWMMFNTDRNKPLCNEKAKDMAIVTNRGTSQIWTTNNCRKINTKCNYTHVNNINMTMIEFFFVRLSDNKHRLLTLYNQYMVLLKTFNGIFSVYDRFMLKIFF